MNKEEKKVGKEKKKVCSRCGACCKQLAFEVPGLSERRLYVQYYKTHGCRVEGNTVIVPTSCPHLIDNLCSIHDKKPFLCKQFNGQKKDYFIPKECAFN